MNKRTKSTEASNLIPGLPDALALQCLVRVPRRYHPFLRAVSKSIRSAVSSPAFFDLRSHLGVTDEVSIIRVRAPFQNSAVWSALYRTAQGNTLQAPLPPHPLDGLGGSTAVAFASTIYVSGGSAKDPATGRSVATRAVWALDCRSNTWSPRSSMGTPRYCALAAVLGGKIYVIGGTLEAAPFAEAMEVSAGRWDPLPDPPVDPGRIRPLAVGTEGGVIRVWAMIHASMRVLELRFDPATWEWAQEPIQLQVMRGSTTSWCFFKGTLYTFDQNGVRIKRLDKVGQEFKEVEGLGEGLRRFPRWLGPKIVNGGGHKLVVMVGGGAGRDLNWDSIPILQRKPGLWRSFTRDPFEAWILEIEVSEEENGTVVGEVVWYKEVMSLHWPEPVEGMPYPGTPYQHIYFPDWNLFQVSV